MLEKRELRVNYIEIIKDMYNNATTNMRTPVRISSEFSITIDLHQISMLGFYLFTLVIDKIIKHLQITVTQNVCYSQMTEF